MSAPTYLSKQPPPSTPAALQSETANSPVKGSTDDPTAPGTACSTSVVTPINGESTSGVTSDTSSGPDSRSPPSIIVSAASAVNFPTSTGILENANNPPQDTIRANFASPPGYVAPAPSFSYSALPRMNSSPGGGQQSSFHTAVNLSPPMPATALQPPVPGQFLGNRPFSHNMVSHANVVPASAQQFQRTIAPGQGNFQGGMLGKTSAPSLQPPVAGQSLRPNVTSNVLPSASIAMQLPTSVPSGDLIALSNFSLTVGSQPVSAKTSETTSDITAKVANVTSAGSVSFQPAPSSNMSLSSSTNSANTNNNPSNVLMPMAPSFTARPMVPSSSVNLGLQGSSNSAPMSSNVAPMLSPMTPVSVVPSPASLISSLSSAPVTGAMPIPQTDQQQIYLNYPRQPGPAPVHQSLWLHPPQASNMQQSSFSLYPGALPAPYPLPMPAMPFPAVPSPIVQPPGVSILVTEQKLLPPASGSLQSGTNLPGESSSVTIDQEQKYSESFKDDKGAKSAEEDAWSVHRTENGTLYYYNSITGESRYQKPSNFKGELPPSTSQTTPVSWGKLPGTDWTLVTTNDGKKYYYDSKNKVSSWNVPTEVLELRKNQEIDPMKSTTFQLQNVSGQPDSVPASSNLNAPSLQTGGRDSIPRTSGVAVSSSALDLIKKKLQEAGTPVTSSPLVNSDPSSDINGSRTVETSVKGSQTSSNKNNVKDTNDKGNMSDTSSDSEDEESGPNKDECIIQFKEMLKERGVAPFSKWEKELPKIVFDSRFKAVPSHSARRALFDHYVRTRAEEERKEKRAAQKAAIDSFKQLLDEDLEDISHKTDYYAFKRKWGNDPRFEAVDRKEREHLLSERIKVAEEKARAIRMAVATNFKFMLRGNGTISTSSRWSRVKDTFRDDPRYKDVSREDRETLFNEYISELKAAEEEAKRSTNSRKDEQEKLKEREREMRKRKEREEQEVERVKMKVRRKEAEYAFRALLVEAIKDPKASWTESKPKLEKDPLGRATNPDLLLEDAEKLFREHIKILYERCVNDYRALLAEVITVEAAGVTKDDRRTVLTSWSEAKRLLKSDLRYSKLPSKDRESLWRRYSEDTTRKRKLSSDQKEKSDNDSKKRTSHGQR